VVPPGRGATSVVPPGWGVSVLAPPGWDVSVLVIHGRCSLPVLAGGRPPGGRPGVFGSGSRSDPSLEQEPAGVGDGVVVVAASRMGAAAMSARATARLRAVVRFCISPDISEPRTGS
jgi:hypothetical protein